MATTTNYGWTTPNDTDLVKDGAAAIRTLGSSIDTTVFNNASAGIAKTIVDAKGDIIAATAADTVARLAVGANDTVLTADSSTATGLKWASPAASGGITLLSTTTLSGASVTISGISSAYTDLYISVTGVTNNTAAGLLTFITNANDTQYSFGRQWTGGAETNFMNDGNLVPPVTFNRTVTGNHLFAYLPKYSIAGIARTGEFFGGYRAGTNAAFMYNGSYYTEGTDVISSLTLSNAGGTFSAGTVRIYGAS
jgi:hypothetical protein